MPAPEEQRAVRWPEPIDPMLPQLVGFTVRRVPGYQARKHYACPSCHDDIPSGVGHVVVWPEAEPEERRHWHVHCWRIAVRRGRPT
ncbi:MAG: hypothetical protein WD638_13450 [Nitriliruptoraceae bacterium]